MNASTRMRWALVLLVATLAGCEGPCSKIEPLGGPRLDANGVNLSSYVAVGTSLSSGFESGGLVDRHQVHSFPSLFARQIGKTVQLDGGGSFTQPTVNNDGIQPLLEIKSYSPLIINRAGRTPGVPTNSVQNFAYHNLGIPGSVLFDLVDTTFYGRSGFFNLITRTRGSVLVQALSNAPTIMSLEYGANEVLGPTVNQGTAPGSGTAGFYAQLLTASLNAIHGALPGTRVAVLNVPDVTAIPFFTTLPPFTLSLASRQPLPLVATDGPLQLGDLVLLSAADSIVIGTGIPAGGFNYLNPPAGSNGRLLPEFLVLRAAEVADTRTQIADMNAAVDSVALRPFVARVDLAGLLGSIARDGVRLGGRLYTSDFVTGGLFSLDGVHPNDLGYALLANQMIDDVNARFGCRIPEVSPLAFASPSASRASPARDERVLPRVEGLREILEPIFSRPR